jgi:serine/threonine protein kinase
MKAPSDSSHPGAGTKDPLERSLAYKYFVAYRLYDGQRFDEMVIPYRPRKSFEKKFRRLLQSGWKIQAWLVALAVTLCLATHSSLPFLMLVASFAAIWMWIEIYSSMKPTHYGFSSKGIRQYWIQWFGDKASTHIPWSEITQVRLRKSNELFYKETWVEFIPVSKNGKAPVPISIRLEGIATGEHRKRLHSSLRQHLDHELIDHSLNDRLNPVKVDGFTTLWLDVLSTTPQRIRDSALPSNVWIANDRYEVIKQLATGGQAVAYLGRAREGALGPDSEPLNVVLKEFMLPYHAGMNVSKKALDNIQREANLLKQLAHPQIVRLVDLFVEDQRAYMVLEHIEGESLRNLIHAHGQFSQDRAVELATQMCDILAHLHGQSPPVLHRDFTPENLILDVDGNLRLIDFNVAQQMESTATRTVVGKHSYIPPEQFRGKATTQSDIYAMGATVYYLLTGTEPEPITTAHPQKSVQSIDTDFDTIVAKATAIDPELRYTTAEDMKRDLLALKAKLAQ